MRNPLNNVKVIGIATLLTAIIYVCFIAYAAAAAPYPTDRQCADAKTWGPAPDAIRPCVRLVGNKPEGGAVRFAVKDASGVVRYSGYVNTPFRLIVSVRVVRLYEDGSFTWKARSRDGRTVTASVGNLQD